MRTLEDMEARAKRHLDGMTVNRDAMAKDVLQLVDAIRAVQKFNEVSERVGFPDRIELAA